MNFRISALFAMLLWMEVAVAQDSIIRVGDSIKERKIYDKIQQNLSKKKGLRKIHSLIFNEIETNKSSTTTRKIEKELGRDFAKSEGKTIRNIEIRVLAPFGYSERDSLKKPNKWEKRGNALHQRTKKSVIKRNLLFTSNDRLDSVRIKESERILRSQSNIRRAYIEIIPTQSPDSLDLRVNVLDSWTIFFDADGSFSKASVWASERNMLGLGHSLSLKYIQDFSPTRSGFAVGYELPNINATNINTYVGYEKNEKGYQKKEIGAYRGYFSKYTKWAGGISLTDREREQYLRFKDSVYVKDARTLFWDAWGSTAFRIKSSYDRKIILSARYSLLDYVKAIEKEIDTDRFFTPFRRYVASVGLSKMDFEQDRYVFKHRDIEDIAVGYNMSYIAGFQQDDRGGKLYSGVKLLWGNYAGEGFLATNIQMGSFFYKNSSKERVIKGQIIYFSPLFGLGNWYFRQFIDFNTVIGLNRKNSPMDRINLNGANGIIDFKSPTLTGTRKSILTLQTQSYSPISWVGFRISPFLNAQIGAIGMEKTSLAKDSVYPKFSIGFLITNDYITLRKIEFSFFYIPKVPGKGYNIYNFSGARNRDFRLPYFGYQMPDFILYQ